MWLMGKVMNTSVSLHNIFSFFKWLGQVVCTYFSVECHLWRHKSEEKAILICMIGFIRIFRSKKYECVSVFFFHPIHFQYCSPGLSGDE